MAEVGGEGADGERPAYAEQQHRMADEVSVKIAEPSGAGRSAAVRVEKLPGDFRKAALGGYRHKRTGLLYHHAATQTESGSRRIRDMSGLRERDTQTRDTVARKAQTQRECGTQMRRVDLELDGAGDVHLRPRAYFSAAQYLEVKRAATLTLQRHWRGYLARCRAWKKRNAIYEQLQATADATRRAEEDASDRRAAEIERRLNPRSKKDFELLYNELHTWRHRETHRIAEELHDADPDSKRAARGDLLAKEAKLLQTIDGLKARAAKDGRRQRIGKLLKVMARPKRWERSDGHVVVVDTPFSVRARELMELYDGLTRPMLDVDERMSVLRSVKRTVAEFHCRLSADIVELIEREADLLQRGRSAAAHKGLRQRIANLFLEFIETPEFNPAAQRFQRVDDPSLRISRENYTTGIVLDHSKTA